MKQKGIGVYTPYLGGYYFGGILESIRAVACERGRALIVIQGAVQDFPMRPAWDQVEGWIVLFSTDGIDALARRGFPLVTISVRASDLRCPAVIPDNYHGARAATLHLLDHGHRRIAFVGAMDNSDMQERMVGYRDALAERGLALDPALLCDRSYQVHERVAGRFAAQRLLAAELACTAVVAGDDELAIGVMEEVQASGRRVPEDMAVIGFDDMITAQYTTPSLTTVRQRPTSLGRRAALLLFDQIAGVPVPGGIHSVPTALVVRQSCGCDLPSPALEDATYTQAGWDARLLRDLVALVPAGAVEETGSAPAAGWPGVADLVQGLAAAHGAGPAVPLARLEQSWRAAVELIADMETLRAVYKLLAQAGEQQVAARPGDPALRAEVEAYLERAYLAMLRAHIQRETNRSARIENLLRSSYEISKHLILESASASQRLDWLWETHMTWGCMGRWSGAPGDERAELTVVGSYGREAPALPLGARYRAAAFPPLELLPDTCASDSAQITALLPLRYGGVGWGVLLLRGPIESCHLIGVENMNLIAVLLSASLERDQLLTSLATQEDALTELGSPVIPLLPGVLLLPLVGAVDAARAQQIMETLLEAVGAHQAHTVLLDITGVPLVDSQVADALLRAARAATLLGARVTLVGVRPEIAQSIVGLGIDLRTLATQPTLAAALRALLRGA